MLHIAHVLCFGVKIEEKRGPFFSYDVFKYDIPHMFTSVIPFFAFHLKNLLLPIDLNICRLKKNICVWNN